MSQSSVSDSAGVLMVRAVVREDLRGDFDHWYETEHLPDALLALGATRARRLWSRTAAEEHFAFYEFPTVAEVMAAIEGPGLPPLLAEFDRRWPEGVTRTRHVLSEVQQITPDPQMPGPSEARDVDRNC